MLDILKEIREERTRQDNKWGQQNHAAPMWLTILGEEYGEACKATLENDSMNYREELVQCAAVVVAMIECYDRHGLKGDENANNN